MPSRKQQKQYVANAPYHIYNRGVGKMDIFHDEQDYAVFLYYLRIIFSPIEFIQEELKRLKAQRGSGQGTEEGFRLEAKIARMARAVHQAYRLKIWKNVELLSFCLMPNHFHLVIFQKVERGIEMLMRRLATGYSNYYRRKHDWEGSVVQGRYNASCLDWEPKPQTLAAARYAERNPSDLLNSLLKGNNGNVSRYSPPFSGITNYPYSSLRYYVMEEQGTGESPVWLNTKKLVDIFDEIKASPNGMMEEIVASHNNYVDFVLSEADFNLEDVRLDHLRRLF